MKVVCQRPRKNNDLVRYFEDVECVVLCEQYVHEDVVNSYNYSYCTHKQSVSKSTLILWKSILDAHFKPRESQGNVHWRNYF